MGTNDFPLGHSIPRRKFVVTSAVLPGLWWLGAPLSQIATAAAAADGELKILTPDQAATLTAVARTIAPHDGLPDPAYRPVLKAIDEAAADAPTHATINSGLDHLGKRFGSDTEEHRVAALKALEHSD